MKTKPKILKSENLNEDCCKSIQTWEKIGYFPLMNVIN